MRILHISKNEGDNEWQEIVPDRSGPSHVVGELTHFVNCIRDNKTPMIDARGGKAAVAVVLATYESAREKTKVSIE